MLIHEFQHHLTVVMSHIAVAHQLVRAHGAGLVAPAALPKQNVAFKLPVHDALLRASIAFTMMLQP